MSEPTYIFAGTQHFRERERLQAIEQVFDPASRRRIQATGIATDWRCLEVGAGAGSIAQWLSKVSGEVVAVDLDTRFLRQLPANIEVLQADIQQLSLPPHSFDLIHARYVLIHIPEFRVVLSKLLTLLKPGGWIVLEEPDFLAARAIFGEIVACQAVDRVNRAIVQMFANKGIDAAFGAKLPALLQAFDLQKLTVENDVPLSPGGSGIAKVMQRSALQLTAQYLATGEATREDIEQYCCFAEDFTTWAIYYATVGVTAQNA